MLHGGNALVANVELGASHDDHPCIGWARTKHNVKDQFVNPLRLQDHVCTFDAWLCLLSHYFAENCVNDNTYVVTVERSGLVSKCQGLFKTTFQMVRPHTLGKWLSHFLGSSPHSLLAPLKFKLHLWVFIQRKSSARNLKSSPTSLL